MPRRSAGILLYRRGARGIEMLLLHPGGPFWARKDLGAWSIPKGEYAIGEDALAAARREFAEETGAQLSSAALPLGEIVQRGGKIVTAFAVEGDFDPTALRSNIVTLPQRRATTGAPSRRRPPVTFPEVDRAAWFEPAEARRRILPAQAAFIERLLVALGLPVASSE
ncbi:MAG: NUDIX domain-containing protein [Hyphomicrobiales bacterium]|nr:NUDIX domain-containing protein [Hyphomicrobiales bacterium]